METLQQPELIRDLPVSIRPIARLETLGAEALKESELLALAMRSLSMRKPEELLSRHSVKELLGMPWARLASLRGMGHAGAAALLASAELVRRTMNQVDTGKPVLQSVSDVAAQAIEIRDKKKEYLLAFFLNARHQLIAREVISIGTLTASLAHPREIFAPAIGQAAAGVLLVHNHPSGDPSPSDEDIRLTKRIAQAGQIMGIELLDHVILAQSGTYSFKTQSQGGL
jgi:DNA repair protein RadC